MVVWERPEPPDRPVPAPLSRERIVRAAIQLADADGLDAVSLRKVAALLDAGPMRLYGYIETKEELLDLMVDTVYAEIRPTGDGWRQVLRSLAEATRHAAQQHEWLADLLGRRPQVGPNTLATGDAVVAAMGAAGAAGAGDAAGAASASGAAGGAGAAGAAGAATETGAVDAVAAVDLDVIVPAVAAVSAYVVGAVRREIAERRAERASGLDLKQYQAAYGPYLQRTFATGRFPALATVVRDGPHLSADENFQAGLEFVLDGIGARISA